MRKTRDSSVIVVLTLCDVLLCSCERITVRNNKFVTVRRKVRILRYRVVRYGIIHYREVRYRIIPFSCNS